MGEGYRVNDAQFNARFATRSLYWKTLFVRVAARINLARPEGTRIQWAGKNQFTYQFQKVIGITLLGWRGKI